MLEKYEFQRCLEKQTMHRCFTYQKNSLQKPAEKNKAKTNKSVLYKTVVLLEEQYCILLEYKTVLYADNKDHDGVSLVQIKL